MLIYTLPPPTNDQNGQLNYTASGSYSLIPLYCITLRVYQIQQISDSTSHHNANTRSFWMQVCGRHERRCRGGPGPGDMQTAGEKRPFVPVPLLI